jgi:hypothetical protein
VAVQPRAALAEGASMTAVRFPAARLHLIDGIAATPAGDGALRIEAGHHGLALYGPYTNAENGVYRVKLAAGVSSPSGAQSRFEVFDASLEGRVYAFQPFSSGFETYVRLYETERLEFRLWTSGEELVVEHVELEPLLLDSEIATAERLRTLIEQVEVGGGDQAALYRLIDRLADAGDSSAAAAYRSQHVSSLRPSLVAQAHAVLAGFHGRSDAGARLGGPLPSPGDLRASFSQLSLTTYDGFSLTPDTRAALDARGYSAQLITATRLHRDYEEPERVWHERPLETGVAGRYPPRHPLFERHPDIDRSFQASLALGRGIAAYCPVSGRLLRSNHGFLQHLGEVPFVFWRFDGSETFYLCTGDISNLKYFLYMPRTNTAVWISDPWNRGYLPEHLVPGLLANLVAYAPAVQRYLEAETRPAAVIGSNNYGHYFWTSMSGLDYACRSGLTDGLCEIVKVDRQFADPQAVYPELAHLPTVHLKDAGAAFSHCVERGLAPIHFTDIDMPQGLTERLRRLARAHHTEAGEPPKGLPRPCVWINLRSHNKAWSDQVEGYANILNALYDDFGQLSAFFDGVPDCRGILDGIRARTRPDVIFHEGLNFGLYDTLNWALEVDAYICVIGSGLVIVQAMAGKRGVAHANHMHLRQMSWWTATFPGPAPVTPALQEVRENGSGDYASYDMDWRVLLRLIRKVLGRASSGAEISRNDAPAGVSSPAAAETPSGRGEAQDAANGQGREAADPRGRAGLTQSSGRDGGPRVDIHPPAGTAVEGKASKVSRFIPASSLLVTANRPVEAVGETAVRLLPGYHGLSLYGPYIPVEGGVYRIVVRARVVGPDARSRVEVDAETRLRASRFFRDPVEFYAHLYSAERLEFRFWTEGEEVLVEGLELESILLDREQSTPDSVHELCLRLVDGVSEPEAVFRLLHRLADAGEREAAEALRERYLGRQTRVQPPVRRAFRELNTPGLTTLSPDAQGRFTRSEIDTFLQSRPPRVFDAVNLQAQQKDELRRLGYHPALLQATRLRRDHSEPQRRWRQGGDPTLSAAEFTSRPPLFERFAEVDRSYQWELATGEGMSAYCPLSGRLVRSQHGFCQHYGNLPFLIYRFEGEEVFYVGTGHSSNAKMFIYMPETGVLVDFRDPWLRFYDNSHVLDFFLTNLLSFAPEVREYLNGPTRPAAIVGNNTYGHMVWVTLTGLQFAAENGLLDRVAEVVELDNYFFPVQPVFPELADKPTTRFRAGEDVAAFQHCVRRGLLPIHFTDALFTEPLVGRIRRAAAEHASPAGHVPGQLVRPLIYINIRAHNKIWLDQGRGYAGLLNAVRDRYGRATAFLDGMPDCQAIADEIRAGTHPEVELQAGLNATFYDKVNWAFACDAYVCPVGSSLSLVQWIADKPGVAHAEHAHLEQLNWLGLVRPGVRNPAVPDYSEVVEMGDGIYCDYNLDWRVLFDLLKPLLDQRFARREASA